MKILKNNTSKFISYLDYTSTSLPKANGNSSKTDYRIEIIAKKPKIVYLTQKEIIKEKVNNAMNS